MSWRFSFLINELPFIAFYWLLASTLLANAQGDIASPVGWAAFGLAVLATVGLAVATWRELQAGPVIDVQNLLDLYRHRSHDSGGPTLVYLHGGGFVSGRKHKEGRPPVYRLASQGRVCISANYRLSPAAKFPDHLVDAKKVIAWVREHGLYGYYGSLDAEEAQPSSPLAYVTAAAPPMFVAHGDQDTYVAVEGARQFVEKLQSISESPIVYAELPGAQHTFDVFHSIRFDKVIDAIEAFAAWIRSTRVTSRG